MSESIGSRIKGLFSGKGSGEGDVTEEEIISMVHEGHEQGVFLAQEAKMIQNVFAFNDKDAKDIMTHRKDIVALDGEKTLRETIDIFMANHYSRFPVYLGNLDNIIGTVHMRELFMFSMHEEDLKKKVRDLDGLMRKPEFIPETHSIHTLFTQMQIQKKHLYIVTDEYGQTSGLITLEDILEEIVGNIEDEHDDETGSIESLPDGSFRMEGSTTLEEAGKYLCIEFEDEDVDTLSGFMVTRYGSVPDDDEVIDILAYGYRFVSTKICDHIVQMATISLESKGTNMID